VSDAFTALADGNRRRIIESLVETGTATATGLAGDLGISRQATAKHLEILAAAGLASAAKEGRERVYRFAPGALDDVQAWVTRVEGEWAGRLDRLASHVTEK